MHFSTLALASFATLALAGTESDLGYLQCVTAVVQDLDFSSCASASKLDCFCASPARDTHRLSSEAEKKCLENGVERKNIPAYLCNDENVPVSPRKGSQPMVRLGDTETGTGAGMAPRAVFPHAEFDTDVETDTNTGTTNTNTDTVTDSLTDPEPAREESSSSRAASEIVKVVTVTATECRCSETQTERETESTAAPVSSGVRMATGTSSAASSTVGVTATSGRVHGTQSAPKSTGTAMPTGVDAQRPMFEGAAAGRVTLGAVMGVVGLVAGLVVLG